MVSTTACMQNEIPKRASESVHTITIDTSNADHILEGTYTAVHIIIASPSSSTVYDNLHTSTRHITVLPHARCTYLHFFMASHNIIDTMATVVDVQERASLSMFCVSAHQKAMKASVTINLRAAYAAGEVRVVSRVYGTAHVELTTAQHHHAAQTTSTLEVRKIIDDAASYTYHGLVHIAAGASGSVAEQQDRSLLGSPLARAVSVPALEVLTHDVQCAHGSALGMVSDEQRWYAQTRGLSVQQADRLLRAAFFAALLQPLSTLPWYKKILDILDIADMS